MDRDDFAHALVRFEEGNRAINMRDQRRPWIEEEDRWHKLVRLGELSAARGTSHPFNRLTQLSCGLTIRTTSV